MEYCRCCYNFAILHDKLRKRMNTTVVQHNSSWPYYLLYFCAMILIRIRQPQAHSLQLPYLQQDLSYLYTGAYSSENSFKRIPNKQRLDCILKVRTVKHFDSCQSAQTHQVIVIFMRYILWPPYRSAVYFGGGQGDAIYK